MSCISSETPTIGNETQEPTLWCNRCGYTRNGAPFQSLYAFEDAYKHGYDILLCDLRFTSDDVPVLEHDDYLNQYYKRVTYMDGSPLPHDSIHDSRVYIHQTTYEDLLQYDFSRGSKKYQQVPICTLADYLSLLQRVKAKGIIELKTRITEKQTEKVCNMVKQMGLTKAIWWAGDDGPQLQYFNRFLPQCNLLLATPLFETYYSGFLSLKTKQNHLAIRFPYNGTDRLSVEPRLEDYYRSFIENDIRVQIGTVNDTTALNLWLEKGEMANRLWCVRSDTLLAKDYLKNKLAN